MPLVARLAGARLVAVRLVAVRFAAAFAAAGFLPADAFWVVDLAVAPALADLLLPPLVRAWATAPLLLHESQRSSERYLPCKAFRQW